jgi:hypothetical protein
MTRHFYRLGRILLGKERAAKIRDEPSWFAVHLSAAQEGHPSVSAEKGTGPA